MTDEHPSAIATSESPEAGARLLFITDDAFQIEQRGCILTPGIPRGFTPFPPAGSRLILRHPDGSIRAAVLSATELIRLARPIDTIPILLQPGVHKSQVPHGTEVWLRSSPSATPNENTRNA